MQGPRNRAILSDLQGPVFAEVGHQPMKLQPLVFWKGSLWVSLGVSGTENLNQEHPTTIACVASVIELFAAWGVSRANRDTTAHGVDAVHSFVNRSMNSNFLALPLRLS